VKELFTKQNKECFKADDSFKQKNIKKVRKRINIRARITDKGLKYNVKNKCENDYVL
jgi:hypothetical protein